MNPYSNTKPYQRWSSAVADRYFTDVDWTLEKRFEITKTDKIISLGSCFAQHIARSLLNEGYNYLFADECLQQPTGRTFSARYGNVYSIRQARQLLERAFSLAEYPLSSESWRSHAGRIIDPFRPNEFPDGFNTEHEMLQERERHLRNVRDVFSQADIVIFTLGLTETWLDTKSGAALPVAPGVYGGPWPSANHQFVNFSFRECDDDVRSFLEILQRINPSIRVILTVSPVSLVATMENQSVAISTCHSKSVLRAVAGELSRAGNSVFYFPSYEIIAGPFASGHALQENFRDADKAGVQRVMEEFLRLFTSCHHSSKNQALANLRGMQNPELLTIENVECDDNLILTMI
jgi:hypothetical protein